MRELLNTDYKMYCHVEGVNFASTVYDTQDISTIRGSSLLLERIPTVLGLSLAPYKPEQVEFGAAKAVFRLAEGTEEEVHQTIAEALERPPWSHMSIVHGLGASPEAARRAARIMQYQTWTVPDPGEPADLPDALDFTRPGQNEVPSPGEGTATRVLSESTFTRRAEGTRNRPNFMDRDHFRPPYDFNEMLRDPDKVPEMIQNKLAVIATDGIKGGELREAFADDIAFSKAMKKFRSNLANALSDWAELPGAHVLAGKMKVPRFDALLWGGDDIVFVMPAWLAMPFMEVFFRVTESYEFTPEGQNARKLYHRVACIIANAKTPIRQMRALALDAEWQLKNASELQSPSFEKNSQKGAEIATGVFSIDIFESAALPHKKILPYRTAQYGSRYVLGEDMFMSSDITPIIEFCRLVTEEGQVGLTRSLIHGALHDMRQLGATVSSSSGQKAVVDRLSDHLKRVQGHEDTDLEIRAINGRFSKLPRRTSMVMAQVAQLLPYSKFKVGELG